MREFYRKYVKRTFIAMLILFVVLSVAAYFGCLKNMDAAQSLYQQFVDMVNAKGIIGEDGSVSVVSLFFNNLQAAGMALLLGFVPFLFLPLYVIITNSVISGAMFAIVGTDGTTLLKYLVGGILPHGIFEIPAICLGAALGIKLCHYLCSRIIGKGKLSTMKPLEFFGNITRIFVLIAVPLLAIAAVVESYITPMILNALL